MSTIISLVTLFDDIELNIHKVKATNAGTSSSPNVVAPVTDIMSITNNTGGTITLTGFNGTHFSSLSTITITAGNSTDLTIKSGAAESAGNFSINATGYTSKTYYYSVVSVNDNQPNPFSLGASITDAIANDYYFASIVTITGINQNITVSLSTTGTGSAVFQKNGAGSWVTSSGLVANGDTIQVRVTASSGNNATTTATLNAGSPNVSSSFSVTTKINPAPGTLIQSPFVLPLKLTNACGFLGNKGNNLLPLYKGGLFVPNITQNNGVSTNQSAVYLGNLSGVYTEISFQKARAKFFFYDNISGGNATITWNTALNGAPNPDIVYGYHPDIAGSMQFYGVLTQVEGTGVTLTSGSGSPSTWSANNLIFTITKSVPTNTSTTFRGYVTLYARHKDVIGTVISTKLNYTISGTTGIPTTPGGDYNVP